MGFFSKIGGAFKKVAGSAWNTAKKAGTKMGGSAWNAAKKVGKVVQKAGDFVTGGLLSEIGKIVGKVTEFTNGIVSKIENVITSTLPFGEYLLPLIEMSQPQLFAYKQLLVKGQTMSDFLQDGSLDVKSLVTNAVISKVPGYNKLSAIGEHVGIAKDLQDQIKSTVTTSIGTGKSLAKKGKSLSNKYKRGQDVVKGFKRGGVSGALSHTIMDNGVGSLPHALVKDTLASTKLGNTLNSAVLKGNRFLNTGGLSKTLKQFSNNVDVLRNTSQDVASMASGVRQAARSRAIMAKGAGRQLNDSVAKLGGRSNAQLNRIDNLLVNVQNRGRRGRGRR